MNIVDMIFEYIVDVAQMYKNNDIIIEHVVVWYRDKKTGVLKTKYI